MNLTVIVHEVSLLHKGNCLKKVPSPEIENKLFQQKKSKQLRFWEHTFLKKTLEFLDLLLYPLKFSRENKASSPESSQNFVIWWHPLEIPMPKTKTHGNSSWFFLDHPWKFPTSFLIDPPGISTSSFFNIPLEIPCPQPPCPVWIFSGINSPILLWWLGNHDKLISRNYTDRKFFGSL